MRARKSVVIILTILIASFLLLFLKFYEFNRKASEITPDLNELLYVPFGEMSSYIRSAEGSLKENVLEAYKKSILENMDDEDDPQSLRNALLVFASFSFAMRDVTEFSDDDWGRVELHMDRYNSMINKKGNVIWFAIRYDEKGDRSLVQTNTRD